MRSPPGSSTACWVSDASPVSPPRAPESTQHVVPVGWRFNAELDALEISGRDLARTKKFRDVPRGDARRSSPTIWRAPIPGARGRSEIRGRAEALADPRALIRIRPERIVSLGIEAGGRVSRTVEMHGRAA